MLRSTPGGPHLPPSPLPLPRCGSGRGRVAVLTFVLTPFRFHTGSGRGRVAVLTFVLAPFRFHMGSGRGRMSGAGAILRLRLSTIPRLQPRSPLSRSAGEGSGVRVALTFLPAPFLSHAAGAEGGGWRCLPSCWLRSAFTRGAEGGEWSGSESMLEYLTRWLHRYRVSCFSETTQNTSGQVPLWLFVSFFI